MRPTIGASRIAELMDRHADALAFYAAQWTTAPDDCVQEAFVELAGLSEEPESVTGWLYRVVRNRALNAARSQRRRVRREQEALRLRPEATEDGAEAENAELLAAVDRLGPEDRELIVLRVWSGLSWEEVAGLVGTSSSTAHRRYAAALKRLKALLEESCLETEKKAGQTPCRQD
ncbi:MAG: sigma-70 family RNA polymerase sigma factor [Planctomycetota bacterium]